MQQSTLPQLAFGYIPGQILYATAELGIADALADGPLGYQQIAKQTETDPLALRRLLRALVGLGLVTQLDADQFELTELGNGLRSGTDDSVREDILLTVMPELWQAWGALADVVRTGKEYRDPGTGLTAHESTLRDAGLAAKYRAAKAISTTDFTAGVTGGYDFARWRTIADFGGDEGTLMAAILSATPDLRGVLYEENAGVERTTATLEAAGVADRCELVVDEPVRPGADAYIANNLIRDWPDDKAIAVLRDYRAVMAPDTRLLLLETLMPAVLTHEHSVTYGLTDLNNLIYTGGRERTGDEYRELLSAAGFTVTAMVNVPAPGLPDYTIIETTPAG